jgi:hypothetical protein
LTFFSDLRKRLDDPEESFDDEAQPPGQMDDWDLDLEREAGEIERLAPRIQQGPLSPRAHVAAASQPVPGTTST